MEQGCVEIDSIILDAKKNDVGSSLRNPAEWLSGDNHHFGSLSLSFLACEVDNKKKHFTEP